MLDRAAENLIVVEIKVDYFSFSIDSDTGNIVTKVVTPKILPVCPFLFVAPRIESILPALVAIPVPTYQRHEQQAVKAMALDRRLYKQGRGQLRQLADSSFPIRA